MDTPDNKPAKKPVRKPATKAPVKQVEAGFTAVKTGLPDVKSFRPVASYSKLLHIKMKDGSIVTGRYQRWDRDMNAHHIQAKAGDGFFYTVDNVTLDASKVDSWALV